MKGELAAGEIDRLSGSHGLVGGEHDRQARETILQVRGRGQLLTNSPHKTPVAHRRRPHRDRARQPALAIRQGRREDRMASAPHDAHEWHWSGRGLPPWQTLTVRVGVNALDRYRAARPDHVF